MKNLFFFGAAGGTGISGVKVKLTPPFEEEYSWIGNLISGTGTLAPFPSVVQSPTSSSSLRISPPRVSSGICKIIFSVRNSLSY